MARACISRDLRVDDAQPAAAVAEHRVELVQFLDALGDDFSADMPIFLAISAWPFAVVRQELVQRRIERADRDRPALHRPEQAVEVVALERQQLGQRLFAIFQRRRPGSSRGIARCGRRTCARCGTGRSPRRRRRSPAAAWSGSSALVRTLQLAVRRRPSSSAWRTAGRLAICSGFSVLSISTCTTSLGLVATWPAKTSPVKPSIADVVAFLEHLAA